MRNNTVVIIPRAFANQVEFFSAVDAVTAGFPPGVFSVTPTLGTDWDGDPAVFFKVILVDDAVPRAQLLAFTKEISRAIAWQVRPLEEWGVLPYFDFVTQSENARIKEHSLA